MDLYLKVSPHRGFDYYYLSLKNEEKTWAEVLSKVEDVLEEQFLDKDELVGIKLSLEIVDSVPDDLELD